MFDMFFSFFVYSLAYNNFLSIHDVDAALQAVESLLAAAGDAPVEGVDHAGGRVVASLYRDVFNVGGMAVVFGAEERGRLGSALGHKGVVDAEVGLSLEHLHGS